MQRWPAQPVAEAMTFFAVELRIGIGQDDEVILRAAEGEHPLAGRGAAVDRRPAPPAWNRRTPQRAMTG